MTDILYIGRLLTQTVKRRVKIMSALKSDLCYSTPIIELERWIFAKIREFYKNNGSCITDKGETRGQVLFYQNGFTCDAAQNGFDCNMGPAQNLIRVLSRPLLVFLKNVFAFSIPDPEPMNRAENTRQIR